MKEDKPKNIIEFNEQLAKLVEEITIEIDKMVKEYDTDMFLSEVKVSINEIPLSSFGLLTNGTQVQLHPYDVSEGTQGLMYRIKVGSWSEIIFKSVELSSAK